MSSLPFWVLAAQSVAPTLGLARASGSDPPRSPRSPACSPSPRPQTQCLLSGWGWGSHRPSQALWGDGEKQALLRGGDPGIPPDKVALGPGAGGAGSLGLLRWRKNSFF